LPDSYGKRQRDAVKARKAEAREARRIARRQRQNGESPAVADDLSEGSSADEAGDEAVVNPSVPEEVAGVHDPATEETGQTA
jgi:hypothetical protein